MSIDDLKQMALDIGVPEMEKYGLLDDGWYLSFSTEARSWAGQCDYRQETIRLSVPWLKANADRPDVILNTVRHEIAHALAGARAGHGPEWKAWCEKVGAVPSRCTTDGNRVPFRYLALCNTDSCAYGGQTVGGLQRQPRRTYLCKGCCQPVTWVANPAI